MSSLALSSAISSLLVIEKQMNVVSSNISNANTAGYTTETEQTAAQVVNGAGAGVNDLGTVTNIDQYLQNTMVSANSVSNQATTFNTYYQDLQQLMGQISTSNTGGNDLSSQLATLQTDLNTLASKPQNSSQANKVVNDINTLAVNLNRTSNQIQTLRTQADQQIADTCTDANIQLNSIRDLNSQIQTLQVTGQSTAALLDQRNTALQKLSGDVSIGYYVDQTGALQVYTSSGQSLLAGNTVTPLTHTPVSMGNNVTYPSGGVGGILAGNTDITASITSGTLQGLVQQRDVELPNAQNALNYLSQQLSAGLNAASNLGSAIPPPSSLSSASQASFQGTDTVTASATLMVRIAIVDSSGQVQNYKDINLSAATNVNGIVTAINTAFGTAIASLSNGGLLLTSPTAGQGIAVSTLKGTLSSTDFSSFFHLNDVVAGGNSAATFAVNKTMLANSSLFPTGALNNAVQTAFSGTSQQNGPPPFAGVGAGDGSTAQALAAALLANNSFTAATATGTVTFANASSTPNLSGTFTINGGTVPVQVSITSGMTLTQIANAINTAATAAGASAVQAKLVGNGIVQLQVTSGGSTLGFSGVTGNVVSGLGLAGSPSGYLGAATTTYGGFASNLIADVASRAGTAKSTQTEKQTIMSSLQSTFANETGVNIDQQTAQLSTLQNLYSASARVITTVNSMFSALIAAVQ